MAIPATRLQGLQDQVDAIGAGEWDHPHREPIEPLRFSIRQPGR